MATRNVITWALRAVILHFNHHVCEDLLLPAPEGHVGAIIWQYPGQQGGSYTVVCFVEAAALGPGQLSHPHILPSLRLCAGPLFAPFYQGFSFFVPFWFFGLRRFFLHFCHFIQLLPNHFYTLLVVVPWA